MKGVLLSLLFVCGQIIGGLSTNTIRLPMWHNKKGPSWEEIRAKNSLFLVFTFSTIFSFFLFRIPDLKYASGDYTSEPATESKQSISTWRHGTRLQILPQFTDTLDCSTTLSTYSYLISLFVRLFFCLSYQLSCIIPFT